jgi:hypothetical protein
VNVPVVTGVGARFELDEADDEEDDAEQEGDDDHVQGGDAGAHVKLLGLRRVGVRRRGDGGTEAAGAARTGTAAATRTRGGGARRRGGLLVGIVGQVQVARPRLFLLLFAPLVPHGDRWHCPDHRDSCERVAKIVHSMCF